MVADRLQTRHTESCGITECRGIAARGSAAEVSAGALRL